ncbi:uncharacterized protein IL334_002989 [Kwoniella shivajii]|uniref:Uncharacterized protein n=1 Tax=Kwoniella shivajii TaxID=564305 RepID=A0ABZ1CWA1_9TREE|nr:hypothetical protein IL334_002989 [Kwoniella shivajii]
MDIDKSSVPRPPRPKRTIERCLAVSCVLVVCGIGLVVTFAVFSFVKSTVQTVRDPHKSLLYNGTVTPDLTSAQVVRPLIDEETKFDILLTIYSRIPNDETGYKDEYEDESQAWNSTDYSRDIMAIAAKTGIPPVEVKHLPTEKVIFEDVILKGLSLSDRDVEKTVKIELPLKRFYDRSLYTSDVRAAVALIPLHPNKLERMEDYTNWRPEEADLIGRVDQKYAETLFPNYKGEEFITHWLSLEHMAYAFPLIEFHDHGDPCNSTDSAPDEDDVEDDLYASIRDEDGGAENKTVAQSELESVTPRKPFDKLKDKVTPGLQPHLVSRSHVYIMNETRLFDRKAYDKAHKNLRRVACGKAMPGGQISRWLCSRTYESNGHWENRFVLNSPEGSGKKQKELAYGPYLGHLTHSAGPKDVHALPVTRHNCSSSIEPDPETFAVNYTLRFSSLTPGRVNLLNNFIQPQRVSHNATDFEKAHAHNNWEQTSGVFGAKAEGTHPWRRFIINVIRTFIALPLFVLNVIYWYTRTSTAGINHLSTYLAAAGMTFNASVSLFESWKQRDGVTGFLLSVLLSLLEISPSLLMLRAVLPVEISRNGWKMTMKRWRWTHKERNSMRRGTGIDPKVLAGIFIGLLGLIYLPNRYDLSLIEPHMLPTSSNPSDDTILNKPLVASVTHTIELFSYILQLAQNQSSKTFAGNYAITAYMILGYRVSVLVYYLPFIVGKFEVRDGLAYIAIIEIFIESALVWQAWNFPRIDQKSEEGEE